MYHTEELILCVAKKPCLWKSSCENYNDKEAKKEAWQDILHELYTDHDSYCAEEKLQLVNELQKKWRNIKDSFTKELNRQRRHRTGTAVNKRRTYRYFDQLKFLQGNEDESENGETPIIKSESLDITATSSEPSEYSIESLTNKKRILENKRKETEYNQSVHNKPAFDPMSVVTTEEIYEVPRIHPDLAFFVSLVPAVQNLTEDQRLVFQMKVIKALRSVKRTSNSNIPSSTMEPQFLNSLSDIKYESSDSEMSFNSNKN